MGRLAQGQRTRSAFASDEVKVALIKGQLPFTALSTKYQPGMYQGKPNHRWLVTAEFSDEVLHKLMYETHLDAQKRMVISLGTDEHNDYRADDMADIQAEIDENGSYSGLMLVEGAPTNGQRNGVRKIVEKESYTPAPKSKAAVAS